MAKQISVSDARMQFAELTSVRGYAGEPLVVERDGEPVFAMVSIHDLDLIERLQRAQDANVFRRLALEAAREVSVVDAAVA